MNKTSKLWKPFLLYNPVLTLAIFSYYTNFCRTWKSSPIIGNCLDTSQMGSYFMKNSYIIEICIAWVLSRAGQEVVYGLNHKKQ